jgi:hypothetical protein
MNMKFGLLAIAAGIAVIGYYGLRNDVRNTREVLETGSVRIAGPGGSASTRELRTRTVAVGAVRLREVELPGGTWIDCADDCRKVALDAMSPNAQAPSGGR